MNFGMAGEEEEDIFAFAARENTEGDKAGDGGGERLERIARRRIVWRSERLFRGEIRTDEFMPLDSLAHFTHFCVVNYCGRNVITNW